MAYRHGLQGTAVAMLGNYDVTLLTLLVATSVRHHVHKTDILETIAVISGDIFTKIPLRRCKSR